MLLPPAGADTEVLDVIRITRDMRNPYADDLAGEHVAVWTAEAAREALALIGDLPGDDMRRCFSPGWGVRARSASATLFEIAFCFHCHGARLWGPAVPAELVTLHPFDTDSPQGQELLARFRAARPD
jgi:hypothetical protein